MKIKSNLFGNKNIKIKKLKILQNCSNLNVMNMVQSGVP